MIGLIGRLYELSTLLDGALVQYYSTYSLVEGSCQNSPDVIGGDAINDC